jgi:hypothetical protein
VTPVHEPAEPASWSAYVKASLRGHELPGKFAIMTQRLPSEDPMGNHRMEIINVHVSPKDNHGPDAV